MLVSTVFCEVPYLLHFAGSWQLFPTMTPQFDTQQYGLWLSSRVATRIRIWEWEQCNLRATEVEHEEYLSQGGVIGPHLH